MKHDKKQYQRILMGMLFVAASAAMVHGCTLEDLLEDFAVDSEGNYIGCRNLQQIMILRNDESTIVYYGDENEGAFADVFAANVCPVAAPNCIYEWISDISDIEDSEEPNKQKGICNNCPSNYMICKDKCVDSMNPKLHIKNCILDYLTCKDDYYDFNDDSSDGCEFQLSRNHVINNQGNLVCAEDYFDLNDDLNNKDESDGCEFQLSPVHIDKTQPQNPNASWNCIDGYADLDKDRYNGCEVNGWTDHAHCGAGIINDHNQRREGEACNNGYVCKSGKCEESCGQDYIVVCDGLCSNTMIDNAHCGGCNATCSITANDVRAAVACQEGGCHAIACQPGYYLADADEEVAGKVLKTCKRCAAGKYTTSATATGCIDCPTTTGAASMVFDAENNICKAETCLAGYVLKDGSCEPCEAGTFSAVGATSCTACADGHFSGYAASSCTKCPAGTYTTDHIQCINCLAGEYSDEGSKECIDCTGDTISAAGSAKCAECKGNTHANYDHTACVGCKSGSDCTLTTGAATMRCSSQNICRAASCLAGYKLINNEKCEPCPAGSISTSDNKCTLCLEGTYVKDNACTQCPAGAYCPTAGLTTPIPCPKGHYCPNSITEPTPCPMGTYRDQPNGTKEGDCSKCPKGRHNDGVGAYECALIPAGYVGINCHDESKKEGCVQYCTCSDNDPTNCSNMYGSKSTCSGGYCMDTTQTTSTSCIADNNGCPAAACCNGACATNSDNCGTCGNKCTGNKTCKFSDNPWKCQ